MIRSGFQTGPILLLLVALMTADRVPAESVFFSDQVAPILQRRCLSCHNDELMQGDFSLTDRSSLFDSGYIDPGNADDSYLIDLVTPKNGKAEMPKDTEPLTADELAILRQWVGQGARWDDQIQLEPLAVTDRDWWSLRPLSGQDTAVETWLDHPVDALIDEQLAEQAIAPVSPAAARTLLRRLSYDLTGLPPTPSEIDTFVEQSETDFERAWQVAVDRLLASPAFGEKWAQHWLDLSRYAETHGYDKDKPRNHAWPYRDYVIRSFNDDKPYSRFVQEQVAGDALFPDEPDGVLGLGFLAAGPWDFIGHWEVGEDKLDGRIAKHLDRDEMLTAVFNVFQSTTVQCAQCHHHKFDPIRMEDYYRLQAVFAALDRADRVYEGPTQDELRRQQAIRKQIEELKTEQATIEKAIEQHVAESAAEVDRRINELTAKYAVRAEREPQFGYHSQIARNAEEQKWVQLDLGKSLNATEIRIVPAYDDYAGIGAGFGFPVRYRVEVSNDPQMTMQVRLLRDAASQDQPNPGTQPVVVSSDGQPFRYVRLTATKLRERKSDFILALDEIAVYQGAENLARGAFVSAKDSIEQPVRWARRNLVDGIEYRELEDDTAQQEFWRLQGERFEIQQSARTAEIDSRFQRIAVELNELSVQMSAFPEGQMVYAVSTHFPGGGRFVATEGTPRPIHLLYRGDLRSPGERMSPGAPPLWEGAPELFFEHESWSEQDARIHLAHYLTDHDNPLVWRSIANRIWLWTFGSPLVGSLNDFGRGGMTPTDPRLLDFLATELRDDPRQSLKSIIRLLVTSRAYRRSSQIETPQSNADSQNRYRWRANRRRLTAEEFRDSLLAVSGVLDRTMGGPSFQDFVIEKPQHSPHYQYHLHQPDDPKTHRRSIYRFVVRSQPQPLLTTLDCADPSISVPRRDESTTALQALAGWNNRLVEFASQQFAQQLQQHGSDFDRVVDQACRIALGRSPTVDEHSILKRHLIDHGHASMSRVIFNMSAFVYLD